MAVERVKIGFLLHDAYAISDTVRAVTGLASALAARHEVEIVSVHRTADRLPFAVSSGVDVRALVDVRASARRRPGGAVDRLLPSWICPHDEVHQGRIQPSRLSELRLAEYLRSTDADVVIATCPYLSCVLAEHGREDYLRIGQEHAMRSLHTAALLGDLDAAISRLDAYVTLTEADAIAYRAALEATPAQVTSIPACRPQTGIEPSTGDAKIVLSAGPLTGWQRHERLVDAFAKVVAVHPDWTLRIHGCGEEEGRLRRRIEELGLYNHVLLIGAGTPMAAEWAKGALAVLPGDVEPSGMPIVEAMGCGLPVVSTGGEHAPGETVTHGQDGFLVPDGEALADGLADAICRLIENKAERRRMAACARRTAERFRPEHIAALYKALIAELGPASAAGRPVNGVMRLRRRARRLAEGLGSARLGPPVRVDCRATPEGSLAFWVAADPLDPGPWRLVLRSRSLQRGPSVYLPLERPDPDGPALAVLDYPRCRLDDGYWDVLVARGRGKARPAAAGLVETARLLDPAVRWPVQGTGQWWIPYTARDGALALRAWFRQEHAG